LLEALNHHRGKGQEKVTVEHACGFVYRPRAAVRPYADAEISKLIHSVVSCCLAEPRLRPGLFYFASPVGHRYPMQHVGYQQDGYLKRRLRRIRAGA
jgi:hypothetical protein